MDSNWWLEYLRRRGSHRCVNCFVHNKHRVGKQVTQCSCRRGPYLPTVPELTHMPLCWWFSRSLETGQSCTENWEGVAVVSLFVTESHRGTTADVARVFSALSHPHLLPASLIRRLSVLYKRRLAAAALTWHCCDLRRTLDRLKSTHYEHKDFPRLSHPSFFSVVVSPADFTRARLHDSASRQVVRLIVCCVQVLSGTKAGLVWRDVTLQYNRQFCDCDIFEYTLTRIW